MTKFIKKAFLTAPVAIIATLGFATSAMAATPSNYVSQNSNALYTQALNHTASSEKLGYSNSSYSADYAYKTANYSHSYKYKPKKTYYKAKPSYYGKSYKHGYKPVYKSKQKSFKHGKSFHKNYKSKLQYKY